MAAFDDIDLSIDELDDDFNNSTDSSRDENDLEKYGVWVKTGPEDIDETDKTSSDDLMLEDLDFEESDDNSENDLLTDEEEELLGDLENSEAEGDDEEHSFNLDSDLDNDFSFDDLSYNFV